MIVTLIALSFSGLVLGHFLLSFNEEARRQRIFCWPNVSAIFGANQPIQFNHYFAKPGDKGSNLLKEPYHFYTYGTLFTGNELLPQKEKISLGDRKEIERKINLDREIIKARYNPKDPRENMLLVPHEVLSWWGMVMYLFFGVVLPLLFVYIQPAEPLVMFYEWRIAR